jgi:2-succinyl-5-enolpyruvyl-6-hydroxy-3-cyclohexene-1-carboxylate synthase
MPTSSIWGDGWREADARIDAALTSHLDAGGGHDGARVVREVLEHAPLGAHVVLASSMAIRHVDRHTPAREDLVWHANRGVAGIDGNVSTALGVAVAAAATSGAPVIAIVGDLALLHDTNAWLLDAAVEELDLTIIVLDDDGGTIFDLLPPGAFAAQRRLFATPHGRDLAHLAALHGLDYARVGVDGIGALVRSGTAGVTRPGAVGGRRLVHVRIPPLERSVTVQHHDLVDAALETSDPERAL